METNTKKPTYITTQTLLSKVRPDSVRRTGSNEYTIPKGWIKLNSPRRLSRKQLKVLNDINEKREISTRGGDILKQT